MAICRHGYLTENRRQTLKSQKVMQSAQVKKNIFIGKNSLLEAG